MVVSLGKEDQSAQAWFWTYWAQHESQVQPTGSAAGLFSGGRVWSGSENHLRSKKSLPQACYIITPVGNLLWYYTSISLLVVSESQVEDPSQPNDEGITALHNAVCAGHTEIVKFLVQFGVNVNAADSDGW